MSSHRIEMRVMGTREDLEVWLKLMRKMHDRQVVEIIEESAPYPNRGKSNLYRIYLKINLSYSEQRRIDG